MENKTKELLGNPQMNLREQIAYVTAHPHQVERLFFDWHCKDSVLPRRAAALFDKLVQVAGSPLLDQTRVYVAFKNNCPAFGQLYDDFRICECATGRVVFCVIPSSGFVFEHGRARIMAYDRAGEFLEMAGGKWSDVRDFFARAGHQMKLL